MTYPLPPFWQWPSNLRCGQCGAVVLVRSNTNQITHDGKITISCANTAAKCPEGGVKYNIQLDRAQPA
jgi:hypothetical protein